MSISSIPLDIQDKILVYREKVKIPWLFFLFFFLFSSFSVCLDSKTEKLKKKTVVQFVFFWIQISQFIQFETIVLFVNAFVIFNSFVWVFSLICIYFLLGFLFAIFEKVFFLFPIVVIYSNTVVTHWTGSIYFQHQSTSPTLYCIHTIVSVALGTPN